jgi:simple sugar transport system permease protein
MQAGPPRRTLRIERVPSPLWVQALIPFFAIVLAFVVMSVLLLLARVNPLESFYYQLVEPLTTRNGAMDVLVKATPILFTGLAVLVAFSGGYFNIGAEGQLLAGAIAAAGLGITLKDYPAALVIPIILLVGFIAGAIWALLPALLRVYLRVDEVVTTLLMNSIMGLGLTGLLTGPWRDPGGWPRTPMIPEAVRLPRIAPPSRLRAGILIAVGLAVVLWWVLRRTGFGVRLRAVGLGPQAARFMGINVTRTLLAAALISGGIAGLAGTTEILGIQGRLIAESSPGYGYTGVVVAMLGGLSAPGAVVAAVFLALIDTGSLALSQALGVPQYLGDVAQAVILLTMLACLLLMRYRLRWRQG